MKAKTTRRALLMSALSLLLCMSMLVGTTFAWFTDSASSANNVIKSGNLDIDVQYTLDGTNWADLNGADDLFKKDLWEPGHTEVVALKIENKGSLALKYAANMNIVNEVIGTNKDGGDIVLSDILTVSTLTQATNNIGEIALMLAYMGENSVAYETTTSFKDANILKENQELHPGAAHYMIIKVDMAETVGNEANHNGVNKPSINFGINVLATQYTYEEDSFGPDYDKDAEYALSVGTVDELADAIANGGKIVLTENVALTSAIVVPAGKSVELDLNGKTITAPAGALCAIQNQGTLTLTGNGTIEGSYTALYSNGNLTIEDGTFTATDGFGVLIDNINGTDASVAVINGGTFTGIGVYNPTDITINGGTFNVGRDPDGATDHLSNEMTLFVSPTFVGAPNTAKVVLNGGTFNGDVYVYDDGITETVFVNNGATITGDVLDNG